MILRKSTEQQAMASTAKMNKGLYALIPKLYTECVICILLCKA